MLHRRKLLKRDLGFFFFFLTIAYSTKCLILLLLYYISDTCSYFSLQDRIQDSHSCVVYGLDCTVLVFCTWYYIYFVQTKCKIIINQSVTCFPLVIYITSASVNKHWIHKGDSVSLHSLIVYNVLVKKDIHITQCSLNVRPFTL